MKNFVSVNDDHATWLDFFVQTWQRVKGYPIHCPVNAVDVASTAAIIVTTTNNQTYCRIKCPRGEVPVIISQNLLVIGIALRFQTQFLT